MKKRLLSILLAVVIALGVISGSSLSAGASSLLGDVDNDGEVGVIDATLIQRHFANVKQLNEAAQKRGCVSGKELSITDATLIRRYTAKMIARFPAEENTETQDVVTIHFTDNKKWGTVYAYLFNYATGEALEETPGVAMTADGTDSDGKPMYSMDVDVSKYDRVIFSNGGRKQTIEAPVTKASCGYMIGDKNAGKYDVDVYTDERVKAGEIITVKMDFPGYPEGEQKTVWIYLPDGYDPEDTDKRYSVLYMDDGQVMLGTLPNDDWRCDKTVRSMMNNGSDGIIIVGISSLEGVRYQEMCPYIGDPAMDPELREKYLETMTEEELNEAYKAWLESYEEYCQGGIFADFTVNTVIPYIDSHYNTNSVRGFTGSSAGGLEAFYIGMEYPEVFDYVGVMSPSLNAYDASVWDEYLSTKDFSGKVPRMYFFCGNNPKDAIEQDLYTYSVQAEGWLLDHDYPGDRIRTVTNDDTKHMHKYWGLYLPELLCWGMEL